MFLDKRKPKWRLLSNNKIFPIHEDRLALWNDVQTNVMFRNKREESYAKWIIMVENPLRVNQIWSYNTRILRVV